MVRRQNINSLGFSYGLIVANNMCINSYVAYLLLKYVNKLWNNKIKLALFWNHDSY